VNDRSMRSTLARGSGAVLWPLAIIIMVPCATVIWLVMRQPGLEAQGTIARQIVWIVLVILVMAFVVLPLLRIGVETWLAVRGRQVVNEKPVARRQQPTIEEEIEAPRPAPKPAKVKKEKEKDARYVIR
jgi:predicted cobalt transporter CbtA